MLPSTLVLASSRSGAPEAAILKAVDGAQKDDCKAALQIIAEQVSVSAFAALRENLRSTAYSVGVYCAQKSNQPDLALQYAESASKIAAASDDVWIERFRLARQLGKHEQLVATVEELAAARPELLGTFRTATWFGVLASLKEEPQLKQRLLKVLASPQYVPQEAGTSTDGAKQQYATILVDQGDKAAAAALVASIDEPRILLQMSVDSRLRQFIPANFDARAAVERHMARMREIAASHRGVLLPQINVVYDLLMLGRPQEALATIDAMPANIDDKTFADAADQQNWLWNNKADAYAQLGRYDDAIAAFRRGIALQEQGEPNISQTINLSETQIDFNHPDEALATLEPIFAGKIEGSSYGLMMFRINHGCANYLSGKIDDAKADLAYIRAHDADAPGTVTDLLMCMGDNDGAAASLIKRLDTPDERARALLLLSDYALPVPTAPVPLYRTNIASLKVRADVQAAIARAGGTRRFNIPE